MEVKYVSFPAGFIASLGGRGPSASWVTQGGEAGQPWALEPAQPCGGAWLLRLSLVWDGRAGGAAAEAPGGACQRASGSGESSYWRHPANVSSDPITACL